MTDDVDEFLAHYGVLGMHWGQHKVVENFREKRAATAELYKKNAAAAKAAGYQSRHRRADLSNVKLDGVRRIENRIANGQAVGKARAKEYARGTATGLAIGAGLFAVLFGPGMAKYGLQHLAGHLKVRAGAKAAANLFADNKGLTSYSTVALAFDKVKGVWA